MIYLLIYLLVGAWFIIFCDSYYGDPIQLREEGWRGWVFVLMINIFWVIVFFHLSGLLNKLIYRKKYRLILEKYQFEIYEAGKSGVKEELEDLMLELNNCNVNAFFFKNKMKFKTRLNHIVITSIPGRRKNVIELVIK